MNYFKNRDQRAEQARIHTAQMTKYNNKTNSSIERSKIYSPDSLIVPTARQEECNIFVWDDDSVSAALKCKKDFGNMGEVAILNFASYKNPGGMFIEGSSAQEESLCHASNLYNILGAFGDYYEQNKKELNKGMYRNRAIYIPDVLFISENSVAEIDVLTCAAPNFSVARRYGSFTGEENSVALRSRIRFVLAIMSENHVDTAILGAYGCGVFAQNPYEVATIFKEELQNVQIKNAIFAIPGGNNLKAFKEVFK